jgi:hypothetical protein
MDLKQEHDELLAQKPEGVDHDASLCVFCNPDLQHNGEDDESLGGDMSKTFSEDELNAAVQAAVAPVQAELDQLRATLAEGEVEAKVAAVAAEADARVTDLQAQLDAAEVRAQEAVASRDELVAWLDGEREAAELAAAIEFRRAERLAAVSEAGLFSDEHIAAHLDRWVALDDDVFQAQLEDWKAIRASVKTDSDSSALVETAMSHTRVPAIPTQGGSALSALSELKRQGVDPRTFTI